VRSRRKSLDGRKRKRPRPQFLLGICRCRFVLLTKLTEGPLSLLPQNLLLF